jgi:hypothetical protein
MVNRFSTALCLALLTSGCGDSSLPLPSPGNPTGPSVQPPPLPPEPVPRLVGEIKVGDTVAGRISASDALIAYDLTVPTTGTLVARLTWDVNWTGTLLRMMLDQTRFPPSGPGWPPLVGRLPVTSGQRYRLTIAIAGSDWIPDDPFELTTAVE